MEEYRTPWSCAVIGQTTSASSGNPNPVAGNLFVTSAAGTGKVGFVGGSLGLLAKVLKRLGGAMLPK